MKNEKVIKKTLDLFKKSEKIINEKRISRGIF